MNEMWILLQWFRIVSICGHVCVRLSAFSFHTRQGIYFLFKMLFGLLADELLNEIDVTELGPVSG